VGVEQNQGLRESDFRAFWRGRNQGILDWLLHESSSVVICLQVGIHTPFCSSFLDFFLRFKGRGFFCCSNYGPFFILFTNFCVGFVDRNSGLEMMNLCICTRRGSAMQAIVSSSLHEPTTVEMVFLGYLKLIRLYQLSIRFDLSCTTSLAAISKLL
jgi:hypothetical protein